MTSCELTSVMPPDLTDLLDHPPTYQVGTFEPKAIDFAAVAPRLKKEWAAANLFGREADRRKIEALVHTRSFYRAALEFRGAFRAAARKKGIISGHIENDVLRYLGAVSVDTKAGRTSTNRYGDMLRWLADQPEQDRELIERVRPMTMSQIVDLANAHPKTPHAGKRKRKSRPDIYDVVRAKLYDRAPTTISLPPGAVAVYIAVTDAMTGESRLYGPVRDEATIVDCVEVLTAPPLKEPMSIAAD